MLSGRLKIGCVPNVHSLLEEKKRILHIPNMSHQSLGQLKNNQMLGGLNKKATTKKEDKVSLKYFLLPIYRLLLVMGNYQMFWFQYLYWFCIFCHQVLSFKSFSKFPF